MGARAPGRAAPERAPSQADRNAGLPTRGAPAGRRAAAVGKQLVARRLDPWCRVHLLAGPREREVDLLAGAVLVSQWPVLGDRVPRIEREVVGEGELRGRVE